jgi:hypothetical protein
MGPELLRQVRQVSVRCPISAQNSGTADALRSSCEPKELHDARRPNLPNRDRPPKTEGVLFLERYVVRLVSDGR